MGGAFSREKLKGGKAGFFYYHVPENLETNKRTLEKNVDRQEVSHL